MVKIQYGVKPDIFKYARRPSRMPGTTTTPSFLGTIFPRPRQHRARPVPLAQLWVCPLLQLAGLTQNSSGAVTPLWRQWPIWHPPEQSQSFGNDFQTASHSCVVTRHQGPSPSRSWTPWLRPPEMSERWHSAAKPLLPGNPPVLHAARWSTWTRGLASW